MTRRAPGHANVEEHPKGSGRYRVRARAGGKLRTIASKLSRAEAEETAAAYVVVREASVLREGVTLSQFAVGFMERRERAGIRGIKSDRQRWKYVDRHVIGSLPVATLSRRDILEWLDGFGHLANATRKSALNLLRVCLQEAVDRELLATNPARDIRVHRAGDAKSDELDGILQPDEQRRLIAAVPERDRPLVVFALLTGLRQAEQWWLKPEDVGQGCVVVRRSRGGLPPKSGKPRTVFLLAPALRALEHAGTGEWLWPSPQGLRRYEGQPPRGWHSWVKAAGIGRRIRWHDLRHTCATSLLAGWWGDRKWTLDEVCQHLGHSTVRMTERYARKLGETTRQAVLATHFTASSPLMLPELTQPLEAACG